MCGIFGATDLKTYESLYTANKVRGNFAGGSLYVAEAGDMYLKKWSGVKTSEEILDEYTWSHENTIYMGHTQAPTSAERSYTVTSTHPFEHGWFIVAHNGVLENHEAIQEEHLQSAEGDCDGMIFNSMESKVDSSVIPALIDELYVGCDVLAINEAFSLIKGTFACWVYSKHTKSVYLVRSGSTLFGNDATGSFSSIAVPEVASSELSEGLIYKVTTAGLSDVGKFKKSSPFFII
jgi:glucosamine 6-phosphate synthetase-like amidotransferase/phosphosugar isomerase protein